jgi:branched-chain amino acid transport system substrate-binding protein
MLHKRRKLLALLSTTVVSPLLRAAGTSAPLKIAVAAEYGMQGSHAAQSIEKGIALAIAEINEQGGLLRGRPLQLVRRDDRGLPARAVDHMRELAIDPAVLAVFCGRFSPVALELVPVATELGILLLDPWAAADGIANNSQKPNYVFRLSLTDSWAIEAMIEHARRRRMKRLTALLPNTGWGRSCFAAIEHAIKAKPGTQVDAIWYNWGDTDFSNALISARRTQSEALLMVANESEGKHILDLVDRMPIAERLPIIAHWGISAGDFNQVTGGQASRLDLVTVQTFAFSNTPKGRQQKVIDSAQRLLGEDVRKLPALVGFAHAYDLTWLLAKAIDKSGVPDRKAIRKAMEELGPHEGLVSSYRRPFSPAEHEALSRHHVFMARYNSDGHLVRLEGR